MNFHNFLPAALPVQPFNRFNRGRTIRRVAFLALLVVSFPALANSAEEPMTDLQREVLARADRELPVWRKKIPASRPRLFFTAETWHALRGRYAAATGRERGYFEAALARARQIVAEPKPAYRSPEEMVREDKTLTPGDAAQELWQRIVGNDIVTLSFALALEDDAPIRAKLRELVLTACSYPQWGRPGSETANRDLACGHLARGIAIAYDWHPGLWSEADRTLIRETIRPRVEAIKGGAYGKVFWAGHYEQNHLHVSVGGLGLCGLAFFDEIPEAPEWTALALTSFERVASESNADGTSSEGIPYWSYGLSYTLQYLEGAQPILNTRSLYAAPYFRHSIAARLHASTPDLSGTLPWGDAVPRDYYGPHQMLYRLASEYRDGSGQYLAAHLPFTTTGNSDDTVWTALWYDPSVPEKTSPDLDQHSTVGGVVNTRSGWRPDDYLLSFKAGVNNVNHGHLDSGALAICFGHDWLLKAPGYGTGKGEGTFWDAKGGRWTYFSNSTESHSTLLVNGRNQRFTPGARSTIDSCVFSPGWAWASADLTGVYEDVSQIRRSTLHRHGDYILVLDEVAAPAAATVEWLAQVPPDSVAAGERITATGKSGSLEIRGLLPAGLAFSPRSPTSKKNDVPADRLKTYALTQRGSSLRYATALIPRFGTDGPRVQTLTADEKSGRQEFTVTGADWRDNIVLDPAPDAHARVLAVRLVRGRPDSVLAVGATEITVDEHVLRFATRADLALQLTPAGTWELVAGTALELAAPLPPGWRLLPAPGTAAPSSATPDRFSAGHYVLQKKP